LRDIIGDAGGSYDKRSGTADSRLSESVLAPLSLWGEGVGERAADPYEFDDSGPHPGPLPRREREY